MIFVVESFVRLRSLTNKSFGLSETFKVDISNTKNLLEGEHGRQIRERDMIVSTSTFQSLISGCQLLSPDHDDLVVG